MCRGVRTDLGRFEGECRRVRTDPGRSGGECRRGGGRVGSGGGGEGEGGAGGGGRAGGGGGGGGGGRRGGGGGGRAEGGGGVSGRPRSEWRPTAARSWARRSEWGGVSAKAGVAPARACTRARRARSPRGRGARSSCLQPR